MQGQSRCGDRVRLGPRICAAAIVLCAGAALASCAGTGNEDGFSAYVADHWPHWAGGMPSDVPPRPGAPGYQEFIAHGQAEAPASPGAPGAAPQPVFQTAPATPAPGGQVRIGTPVAASAAGAPPKPEAASPPEPETPAAAAAPQADPDSATVVRGGLY